MNPNDLFFDSKGNLNDINFANKAVSRSSEAIGIISKEGIVLAVTKDNFSMENSYNTSTTRIFLIDAHITCVVSGLVPDANFLINQARMSAQHYKKTFQEMIPVKKIVKEICQIKYYFTTKGSNRLFGVSFLIAGWDGTGAPVIYKTDPDGRFWSFYAIAIGYDSIFNQDLLSETMEKNLTIFKAIGIVINILNIKYNYIDLGNILEISILRKNPRDEVYINVLSKKIIKKFFKK